MTKADIEALICEVMPLIVTKLEWHERVLRIDLDARPVPNAPNDTVVVCLTLPMGETFETATDELIAKRADVTARTVRSMVEKISA